MKVEVTNYVQILILKLLPYKIVNMNILIIDNNVQIPIEDLSKDFETPEKLSKITESVNESSSVRR